MIGSLVHIYPFYKTFETVVHFLPPNQRVWRAPVTAGSPAPRDALQGIKKRPLVDSFFLRNKLMRLSDQDALD